MTAGSSNTADEGGAHRCQRQDGNRHQGGDRNSYRGNGLTLRGIGLLFGQVHGVCRHRELQVIMLPVMKADRPSSQNGGVAQCFRKAHRDVDEQDGKGVHVEHLAQRRDAVVGSQHHKGQRTM